MKRDFKVLFIVIVLVIACMFVSCKDSGNANTDDTPKVTATPLPTPIPTQTPQPTLAPLSEPEAQKIPEGKMIYYEDFDRAADDEPFLDRYRVDHADPLSALLDDHLRGALVDAIDRLPEREKLLMSLYYERGLNLREIGAVLEVSESRVCQLHSQAVARLRARLREQAWVGAEN